MPRFLQAGPSCGVLGTLQRWAGERTLLVEGRGRARGLELLEELGHWVKAASLCGLGGTASNPVLSTLRYFRDEYEAHPHEGRCPAGACRALIRLTILADLCTGCGLCRRECPAGAISGEEGGPQGIDAGLCTRCHIEDRGSRRLLHTWHTVVELRACPGCEQFFAPQPMAL